MYLFTKIQGYFELKTPSSNAPLHNITELSQNLKKCSRDRTRNLSMENKPFQLLS